ncbi:MAG: TIGR00341 family protein [Paraprevotella sp.]|nr:TIGR00341 family protein [Paraprevotella sp.]MDD5854776.1 TIGR00341 family protein [Prevotella sp.]
MASDWKLLTGILKKYFNVNDDKENENDIIAGISQGVSFRGANLWVLIFAIFIASLGLNVNSTAVIIGAMLISPLMGPIVGMGLAIGINDSILLKKSIHNYLIATLISVLTATIYFFLSPLDEAQSELLARTSPTLYDVMIALFGGAAGILALSTKGKGNVLPGVAIATALMPPLCTAGYGLAMGNIYYFLGAFYLFFINTVFIALSTYLGVHMMGFSKKTYIDKNKNKSMQRYIAIIVVMTMVPACFMTFNIIRESITKSHINKFVKDILDTKGTRIISYETNKDSMTLKVVAVGKEISSAELKNAEKMMDKYNISHYHLQIIQGISPDSLLMYSKKIAANNTQENYIQLTQQQQKQLDDMQQSLDKYRSYEKLTNNIAAETKILFPEIKYISLAWSTRIGTDSMDSHQYLQATIWMPRKLDTKNLQTKKIKEWLSNRTRTDSIVLVVDRIDK